MLAKYPFLKEVPEYINKQGITLDELISDVAYGRARAAGKRRVLEALSKEGIADHTMTETLDFDIEILSYPLARMQVSCDGSQTVIRRYSVAEGELAARRLMEEDMETVIEIAGQVGLRAEPENGGKSCSVSHADFLKYTASGHTIGMRGVSQVITERKLAEAEIEKRASELQTVAEVGTAAATTLDSDKLLFDVVELTKANFDLYHAHIYLLNRAGDSLVLAAGAGEPGAQMVAQGWQIAADSQTSLVARAARTREGVIANDVQATPDFLPNPLLPDTRSELAVPLIVGDRVLGVLDVQSDEVDHFTPQDVAIQTTLAGQIATALDNANLFEQVDRNLKRTEIKRNSRNIWVAYRLIDYVASWKISGISSRK